MACIVDVHIKDLEQRRVEAMVFGEKKNACTR